MSRKRKTYQSEPQSCLGCGAPVDGHTEIKAEGKIPKPGDVTICFYCRQIMIYDDNLKMRHATDAELKECMNDPELRWTIDRLGAYHKEFGAPPW